jgi:hypothetical protein
MIDDRTLQADDQREPSPSHVRAMAAGGSASRTSELVTEERRHERHSHISGVDVVERRGRAIGELLEPGVRA